MFNIKITQFFSYLILINFLVLVHPMQGNNAAELIQLNSVLNALASKVDTSSVGLIEEFLVGKKFKDIFTEEQLRRVTPKINGDELVLLKYDRNQNIYQLKPLQQHGTTCGAHAFKNSLWMINGLRGNLNSFIECYLKILDEATFDKYFGSISCKKLRFIPFEQQKNDIINGKISCIQENECLPKNSLEYLDQMFCFTYAPKANPMYPGHVGESWSELYELAKKELKKIEPEANIDTIAKDATILFPSLIAEDIMKFYNQIIKSDFCLGIYLSVDNGSMGHATCLMAHKIRNKIEYLFLDSMNMAFDGGYPYMPLIEGVKGFIENPENFKKALIRKAYTNVLLYVEYGPLPVFQIHLDLFINDKFKGLNLLKSELYQTYKPHFCKLIKDHMTQDSENRSEYEEILQKMNCG